MPRNLFGEWAQALFEDEAPETWLGQPARISHLLLHFFEKPNADRWGGGLVVIVVNVYMPQRLSSTTFSPPSQLCWTMVRSAFPGLTCCVV